MSVEQPPVFEQRESATEAEEAAWAALQMVEDPELPVSIVDLGLIYDVSVDDGAAEIDMTLTYSGCPAREVIVDDVERAVGGVTGIETVIVTLVYTPTWSWERITDRGRRDLREHGLAVPGEPQSPDPNCYD